MSLHTSRDRNLCGLRGRDHTAFLAREAAFLRPFRDALARVEARTDDLRPLRPAAAGPHTADLLPDVPLVHHHALAPNPGARISDAHAR